MSEGVELPGFPVPTDFDLSKLDGFMLDTVRLLGSELVALSTGDEFKAAVLLWCRAWKQRPSCSLPDDDRVMASFAMVPPAKWPKVKEMALRGFRKCSDGRLYHLVLVQDGLRAQKAQQQRQAAINKRWAKPRGDDEVLSNGHDTGAHTAVDTGAVRRPYHRRDGTGRSSDPNGSAGASLVDPLKALFDTGVQILTGAGMTEKVARSLVGKWRKEVSDERLASILAVAAKKTEPVAYITAAVASVHRGTLPGLN